MANSTNEYSPLGQAYQFVKALRSAGIPTTFVTVTGRLPAGALLTPQMKQRILEFLSSSLQVSH